MQESAEEMMRQCSSMMQMMSEEGMTGMMGSGMGDGPMGSGETPGE